MRWGRTGFPHALTSDKSLGEYVEKERTVDSCTVYCQYKNLSFDL